MYFTLLSLYLHVECPATKADIQQISEKLDAIHKDKGEKPTSSDDKQEKKEIAKGSLLL